ncbi:MAG: hypothetical protein JOY71_07520 [Acetobacteraceae bacterium]|nr:hypothetical protein [Acetobacteraceae bacterium]MBV8590566.1 hypothetical protein [Acetobacteraceae bacterium]
MIRATFSPLAGVALLTTAVAGALVAWEISDLRRVLGAGDPASAPAARPALQAVNSPPTPAVDVAGRTQAWVSTVLARPLFSPDRRPAAGPAQATGSLPRLTGTVVGPFGRAAIFAGDPKAVAVAEGGRIQSYSVRSIGANEVEVIGPEGVQILRPSFAPAPPPGAARPTAAPPPVRTNPAAPAR